MLQALGHDLLDHCIVVSFHLFFLGDLLLLLGVKDVPPRSLVFLVLKTKSFVRNFASLLREVHCLRASVRVVIATLLVLQESLIALDRVVDRSYLLVVLVTRGLSCHDLTGDV